MSLSLILVTIIVILLLYYGSRAYNYLTYWQRNGIESEGFSIKWALMPFHEYLLQSSKKYGRIYGAYTSRNRMLIVNDVQVAKDMSIKEFHKFPVRYSFHIGTSNISKAIFFMKADEDWKRVRSIVTPAFTTGKLKGMLSPIERIVNNFISHLEKHSKNGNVFDIKEYTSAFAMDVIASCGYGIDVDSLSQPNHPIVANAKRILGVDASISMIICIMFPSLAKFLGLEAFDKKAITYFDELTFEIIERRFKNGSIEQNRDLIGLMMKNLNKDNGDSININNEENENKLKGISKEEISGQGIIFFLAGFDTSNTAFCHVIYYLTKHPEWQEKLYQELVQFKSQLNYDTLRELPILNAIINETLRLNPSLLVVERESVEDYKLPGTEIIIPKQTMISIQPYIIHRDPEYFPDPESFKPERFLDQKESSESNFAYMPFGVGPRLCVGMRFAQNELRIGIANFVLNYKLEHNPDLKLQYFKGNALMTPKNVMVRINKR